MNIKDVLYLPSGRIFIADCDGYPIECTEMRDVSIQGKEHLEVRTATDPRTIWKHLKSYQEKWLLTVSTQKGCTFNCKFCDVANLPFKGNLSANAITDQVRLILENTPYVNESTKVKIGFARMGEPACNLGNVLDAMADLPRVSKYLNKNFTWLPCFNTILPKGYNPEATLQGIIDFKEQRDGFMHIQISCNSTDEVQRQHLFGGAKVLDLESIVKIVNKKRITNRTITLNFIVMKGIEVSVDKLQKMGLNGNKFAVKLIPLNHTERAEANSLETVANYNNYEKLVELQEEFRHAGIPTVVDAIAKCEEAGLCCGQLAQIYL